MNDMSSVIIPKSDQINADDLQGRSMTITIAAVQLKGGQEQPVSIYFEGSDKAFRPCKSMCRVLVQGWGLDANEYVGKSLTLYCDPTVKFGPLAVGGIRISNMSHIEGPMTMALTATKGVKKAYKVLPLVVEQKADKAADGVRTLIARINSVDAKNLGNVINDPVVVKQRAWLAENRPELAAQVDTAIAALSDPDDPFEGPDDTQRGDAHDDESTNAKARSATDDLLQRIRGAKLPSDLATVEAVLAGKRGMLTEEMATEVETALSDARETM